MRKIFMLLAFALMIESGLNLSLDPDASTDLEQYIRDDFTISLRHIRPRRKAKISIEALFMIDFPSAKNKFTFYLDRKAKRVTIDINSNSQIFSKHLNAPSLNETITIRSLAVSFSENKIALFIDCKNVYKDEMEFNLSKLYLNMDEPDVKLLRERKYPLFIDRNIESALSRTNCQKTSKQKGYRKMMKDSESHGYYNDQDVNRKRGRREHRYNNRYGHSQNQLINPSYRGDISVVSGDCDENLLAKMNDLIALVKKLEKDIANQHGDVRRLQSLIENCAGC
ncbi:CLUMA_CG001109, isoform A [Clunio marinus]|uniref:CLUMA_CG001109, isoform A n=1 Tax=Clunio marinus TaxID=568069 RepID=A0A1J1HHF3_9DIPT|nr:CLUMA_CG001109, isoform A [Clunio marinus]